MSEAYVECMVKGKPNGKAKGLIALFIVLAVAAGVAGVIISGYFFIACAGAAFGIYMASQYIQVEYEYLYLDKEITIDKIYNQSKRKKVASYSFEKIEVIAPIKSYHLDNFGKVKSDAKDYSIGYEDKPDLRYVFFYERGEQVIFSPNEEMIKAFKNASPRKVFTD